MGKYNGKVLTAYITPTGVRVAEGENKNGSPFIQRFFVVSDVQDYFSEIIGSRGNYEVVNMSGLVSAIVQELHNQHCTCKRIMICSNCFSIETSIRDAEAKIPLSQRITADISKQKKEHKGSDKAPGKMSCSVVWGDIVEDGKVHRKATDTVGDKFALKSLVQEFYRRGYEVISISDTIGTLINFRHTEEANFDSAGKVIFDFDTSYRCLAMRNDLPISIDPYAPMSAEDIEDRIDKIVESCIDKVGRNPKVYITGELMQDTKLYSRLIDKLELAGYNVYDMFDRPTVDDETGMTEDGNKPLTADYSANIAMFMNAYAKNVVSLVPPVEFSDVFAKNSKAIASGFLALSLVCMLCAGFLSGKRFLEMRKIKIDPPRVASLQQQLDSLKSNQLSLQSTIDTLTQADVTVQDLMNFIVRNQSPTVTVVSMDTEDMLTDGASVTDASPIVTVDGTDVNSDIETGELISGNSGHREAIIIRGYARTGTAAIAYYDKLFNSGITTDPILNGVEQYTLPNGEEVYIFEIRVGGNY